MASGSENISISNFSTLAFADWLLIVVRSLTSKPSPMPEQAPTSSPIASVSEGKERQSAIDKEQTQKKYKQVAGGPRTALTASAAGTCTPEMRRKYLSFCAVA